MAAVAGRTAWSSDPIRGVRLEGLDVWRTMLTIAGVALHATMLRPDLPLYVGISIVSEAFRMGTFVLISGLLAGISLARHPTHVWFKRRLAQIGIPMAFGWFVLCPFMGVVLARMLPAARIGAGWPPFDWHHIWFLVGLLLYTPVACAVDRFAARSALFDELDHAGLHGATIRGLYYVVLPLATFWIMALVAAIVLHTTPPSLIRMMSQWKLILGYLPLFVTGLTIARSAAVRGAIAERLWPAVAILVAMLLLYAAWYGWLCFTPWGRDHAALQGVVRAVAMAWCPPAVGALVLRSAAAGGVSSPLFRTLGDASMTMYIVHYPILFAVNAAFAWVALPEYGEYFAAFVIGLAGSYAVHRYLVCRSRVWGLLLNGRMATSSAPRATGFVAT
ncbi:Peptidoglycan/LPS O-acetylase OafA/YrhL, contains acyltransferase and SGNH-hydrolase domains [Sphingomonas gellani]|uniref:Peptidoglycan/LPS O-acetylase OafA/YrhL, contains acyltransferase and SGNH-hydrolase domains n=1 Tax=Sphingomonas gellani TaxID=1166340 RepID=A0A1H8EDW9_9SPHN|nr:acyltransferase family protein [Sphingomonas gellani]SEN17570.1 Peptidoglycan/LPS O-acetylase OafA/YrhL, contains acyltransferase and SGNH-hydrolase domains [Sphingomonas gellani]